MSGESVEIRLKVGNDGDLVIPKDALDRLNIRQGASVHIRLSPAVLSGALRARNVTEEEIEAIAALQLEPRENVVRFLATESAMSGNKNFRKHLRRKGKTR